MKMVKFNPWTFAVMVCIFSALLHENFKNKIASMVTTCFQAALSIVYVLQAILAITVFIIDESEIHPGVGDIS